MFRVKSMFKTPLLLLVILLGGLVFAGCQAGPSTIPKGWSGGVIDNGILFVGSMEGKLVAANTTDGSLLWSVPLKTPEATNGGFGCARASTAVAIYGSPAVSGDLVYVGDYNGKIYAFLFDRDEPTVQPREIVPRVDNIGEAIVGGMVASGGKVYFGAADGKVYALNAADGSTAWEKPFATGGKIWSAPTISGDTLYIGSFDKKLYALNVTDGSKKWEFETEGAIVSTPVIYGNTVYIGSFDRYLYAVDATNGNLRWKFMAENWFWAKPVIYNGTVYASSLDGKVYALKADTGEKLDEFNLGNPISSSPVLVDDLLVVVATKERPEAGMVYIIDTNNHQPRQPINLGEKVYAPLVASKGKVYIHTDKDALYEIDVQSGAKREFNIK